MMFAIATVSLTLAFGPAVGASIQGLGASSVYGFGALQRLEADQAGIILAACTTQNNVEVCTDQQSGIDTSGIDESVDQSDIDASGIDQSDIDTSGSDQSDIDTSGSDQSDIDTSGFD